MEAHVLKLCVPYTHLIYVQMRRRHAKLVSVDADALFGPSLAHAQFKFLANNGA